MAKSRNISTTSSIHRLCRAAPAVAALCLLGACSSVGGDAGSLYILAKNLVGGGSAKNDVTLQQAGGVPYASMGIRLGNSPQSMLVLAADAGGQRLWTSSARIAITTSSDGHIIRTAGFGHDLGGYQSRSAAPGEGSSLTRNWQAGFPEVKLYSVAIVCRVTPAGAATIVILGQDIQTNRIDESCKAADARLDWSFENRYWVDPASGLVWRSVQHVNPQLDPIEIEILRPPG